MKNRLSVIGSSCSHLVAASAPGASSPLGRVPRRHRKILVAGLLASVSTAAVWADPVSWNPPAGSPAVWELPENWSTGVVPSISDDLLFPQAAFTGPFALPQSVM